MPFLKREIKIPVLEDGSRVSIIGGGPAGSFLAIHILREAEKNRRKFDVSIIDKSIARRTADFSPAMKGCNFCAGVIFPRLHKEMAKIGIVAPPALVCEEFTHVWIQGTWKNFPVKIPRGQKMYSVFRGTLPIGKGNSDFGLDNFLLKEAHALGAKLIAGEATEIIRSDSRKPIVTIKTTSSETIAVESDFAVICTGISSHHLQGPECNPLIESFRKINPRFRPPMTRPAFIFELKPGNNYLRKHMHKELYFIVSGSKSLRLDHIALAPKKEYLTVALVGKSIDKALFPEDAGRIVKEFLSLSQIRAILPGITVDNTPISCKCSPRMALRPARAPFTDRIGVAGDALGARLYRDGLYSAFISAKVIAHTAIYKGLDSQSLTEGCDSIVRWLEKDNRYGKIVFDMFQIVLKSPVLSRIFYQSFATEMKFQRIETWSLGGVLRKTAIGVSDYQTVFRQLVGPAVLRSVLRGMGKTARNVITEYLFGLSWETFGRYPTVILHEKRDYFKKSIAAPLGIDLDEVPELERMYAVKIRASSRRIFDEIGKFGEPDAKFLKLRFVKVERVSGLRNQTGAVVRYKLKKIPVAMDIRLTRSIPNRSLYYKPAELFSRNGKLIFDIAPTRDGNNRLVIYTAFDFKKGRGVISRIFWKAFKALFPEFAHDVVWNHAICRIKGEAEKQELM